MKQSLSSCTVNQLKELLRKRNMRLYGSKNELILRLEEHKINRPSRKRNTKNGGVTEAAKFGDLSLLKSLLEKRGNEKYNKVALKIATINGHLHIVKYLIKTTGTLYIDYVRDLAMDNRHLNILKYLIENVSIKLKKSMLYNAASIGDLTTLKYLIKRSGKVHSDGNYIVECGAQHLLITKYLFEEVENMHYGEYIVALKVAGRAGKLDVVKYVIGNLNYLGIWIPNGIFYDIIQYNNHPEIIAYIKLQMHI